MNDITAAVALLEQHTDEFRVLRRLVPSSGGVVRLADEARIGLYVDCETNSLDTGTAKVIELGAVPFTFTDERIVSVGEAYCGFEDPGEPIPEEVTALTGITDGMVSGQRLNDDRVNELANDAVLIIAHHAAYDRPILERRLPVFVEKYWACSHEDVEWKEFGCACSKLSHVLMQACGEFYEAHRATDDCYAGVRILEKAVREDRTAFSYLLENARKTTARIWAIDSPFAMKDVLKARGYFWPGDTGRHKAWYRDVLPSRVLEEYDWLKTNAGVSKPKIEKFNALTRYSNRT